MAQKLGDLIVAVAADLNPFASAMGRMPSMIAGMGRNVARQSASFLGDVVKMTAGVAGGNLLGGALGDALRIPPDLVKDSVMAAAGIEKLGVQFEVLAGSAENARDLLAQVKAFGVESGMGLEGTADAAKQLLAAGVGLKQIVPTLGMLSDITMGDRAKLGRASLAYTQVRAAGNVQGDELNQLNELGIPIKAAIADAKGIDVSDLAKAVENRQVSFRDLQAGLKALTSEGGKFYGMTAKGADTLDGSFGKLGDAIEDLKREFGRAIVEETGLRDALKDGTKFAGEMRAYIDLMRPGIKFVGDTIKGVGHVISEIVRHGPLFGEAFVASLRHASPLLADMTDAVVRGINSLKDFKLDPKQVVTIARDIGLSLGRVVDHVIRSLGDGLGGIYQEHVKPIVDALKDAANVWNKISEALRAPADLFDQLKRNDDLAKLKDAGQLPEREAFQKERFAADGFADVIAKLERAANRGLTLQEIKDPQKRADAEDAQHFLRKFIDDARKMRQMQSENEFLFRYSPNLKQANEAREAVPRYEDALIRGLKRDAIPAAEKLGRGDGPFTLKGQDLKAPDAKAPWSAERAMADAAKAFEDSMAKLVDQFAARQNPVADPMKGPLGGLVGGMALVDPAQAGAKREEFKLDDVLPRAAKGDQLDRRQIQLPTAAEWGSQAAADLWQRSQAGMGGGVEQQQLQAQQQAVELLKSVERNTAKRPEQPKVVDMKMR